MVLSILLALLLIFPAYWLACLLLGGVVALVEVIGNFWRRLRR